MKIIQTLLILATVALLVEAYPQNSTFAFTTLAKGINNGSLPIASDVGTAFHVQSYRLWIPEGIIGYQLAFNDNGDCDKHLTFSIRSDGFPCSAYDFYDDDDEEQPCNQAVTYNGNVGRAQPVTNTFYADAAMNNRYGFEFRANSYVYLAVGRTGPNPYLSGYNKTCSFSINATIFECPQGQVSVNQGEGGYACISYANATSGITYSIKSNISTSPFNFTILKLNVPQNTAYIVVAFNSSSINGIVRGKSYGAPTGSTTNECSIGNILARNFYQNKGICYVPRSGDFYFSVEDNTLYNATISFYFVTCPAGLGGYNCSANATSIASAGQLSTGGQFSVNVSVNSAQGLDEGLFSYFYIDFPTAPIAGEFSIQVDSDSSNNEFFFRKYGFPEYQYDEDGLYNGISTLTPKIIFNQFDWVAGGRYYFGLFCYYNPYSTLRQFSGCTFNVNVNVNIQQQISTGVVTTAFVSTGSGSVTTGGSQTATGSTTDSEDSSVSIILPSFISLIALFIVA